MVEHFHDHRSVYLAGYESDLSKLCNSEELFLLVLMLCTIYQANPLDSLDKLGCFVLLYRARIDLRAPFRVLLFCFREVSCADGDRTIRFPSRISASICARFRGFCITFENSLRKGRNFYELVEKINNFSTIFSTLLNITCIHKYSYRRDICSALILEIR